MISAESQERFWAWVGILIILAFLFGLCTGCARQPIHDWMPQMSTMTAFDVRNLMSAALFLLFICALLLVSVLVPPKPIDDLWTCLGCLSSFTEPDWTDTSDADNDGQPKRTHLPVCPYCGSSNMRAPRVTTHHE